MKLKLKRAFAFSKIFKFFFVLLLWMSVAQKRGREEGGEEQRRACEAALCAAWASAAELRAPAPGKPELEAKLGTMVQVGTTQTVFF